MSSHVDIINYEEAKTGAKATFKLDEFLGRGQFGEVYKAYCIESDVSLKFPDCLACKRQKIKDEEDLEDIK